MALVRKMRAGSRLIIGDQVLILRYARRGEACVVLMALTPPVPPTTSSAALPADAPPAGAPE